MDFDQIADLQARHPAWALLRATTAPLVLSFLGRVFVTGNSGGQPASRLVSLLDDELYALNQRLGDASFPRSAQAYLDEWSEPDRAWLRTYYPTGTDEAHYDITPPVEKTLLWLEDLRGRQFVGTESRLNTLFELLREMVFGADDDLESQLSVLRQRRTELDAQIAHAERGELALLDPLGQRDRYYQFTRNARELLADFRQVEENFRSLDRQLREQIAGWRGTKGELLDEMVTSRGSIADSDQGRSFTALFDFLLSSARQQELTGLLDRLAEIEVIGDQDTRLRTVHFDWIEAGGRTQATVRQLSEQLRRFLDDQVWLENRRVFEVLRSVEAHALAVRDDRPPGMEIDAVSVPVSLPFDRPLHIPPGPVDVDSDAVEVGDDDFEAAELLDQTYLDRDLLIDHVRGSLRGRAQVTLDQVLAARPLDQGLAELVGYLGLSDPEFEIVFDPERRSQVSWEDEDPDAEVVLRTADLPTVVYTRRSDPQTRGDDQTRDDQARDDQARDDQAGQP